MTPKNAKTSPRRNRQLVRCLAIHAQLRAGGSYTLPRLAKEHGTCERTIRRDLHALEAAGVAIQHSEEGAEHRGRWWIIGRKWL